jgi:transposase
MTPKQEHFAQCIADKMTQADAYRMAYGADKMKAATIHKRASELMLDGEITGRVKELQERLASKSLWTREMSVKALISAYEIARDTSNSGGMTGAIKEINAMHGYNAPQKIDLNAELTLRRIERVVVKP